MQQLLLSAETPQLPAQHDDLSQHGRYRRALDAHVQWPNEDGVKDRVQRHSDNGRDHRRPWLARRAQRGIQTQIEVGNDVAQQQDEHILMGMGQRLVTGTKEPQDGV